MRTQRSDSGQPARESTEFVARYLCGGDSCCVVPHGGHSEPRPHGAFGPWPPSTPSDEGFPPVKTPVTGLLAGTAVLAVSLTALQPAAAIPSNDSPGTSTSTRSDDRPNPFAKKQARERAKAMELLVNGKASKQKQAGGGSIVTLADGTAVEMFDNKKQ